MFRDEIHFWVVFVFDLHCIEFGVFFCLICILLDLECCLKSVICSFLIPNKTNKKVL
jgi:hypothetical protein